MSSDLQPKSWNIKPQLTKSPNLWRDCHWCYAPGMVSADQDIISGDTLTNFDPARFLLDKRGRAYSMSRGSAEYLAGTKAVLKPTTALSVAVFTNLQNAGEATAPCISSSQESGQYGNSIFLGLASNKYRWLVKTPSGEARIDTDSFSAITGPQLLVGVRNDAGNIKVYYGENEVDAVEDSTMTASFATTTYPFVLGAYFDVSTGRQVTQKIYWAAYWDKELTEKEVDELRRDPFTMLRPAGF